MRLLIVEDNPALAASMKAGLERHGFRADIAATGDEGEQAAWAGGYDAVLLDLNLPDKDGLDILRFWRAEAIDTPVIIITARDEVEQRACGLDLGADDYVTKPFQLLELAARVRAVIRRRAGRAAPDIAVGRLLLNPASRTASWNGAPLALKAKEFDILEYVAGRHPAVVSSEEIAEHVYDGDFDPFSSVLRVHIARLKKALATAADGDVLVTMRGKGYYLCEK